ncbi:M3 family oligoendopeptidase [Candidatus Woesearchaeota archaeon]|nr:M3 family oligoendopeptidase [Candidatus Woesearchaeota archaeon]
MKKEIPSWDLSDLYKNINDPKISSALKQNLTKAEQFEKTYRGKIKDKNLTSQGLLNAIKEYEAILQENIKPEVYANLMFAADVKNPRHGAFMQQMKAGCLDVFQKMLFFELELLQQEEKKLELFEKDPVLKNYRHYLEKQRIIKPHRLSEAEEKILNDKSLTSSAAFYRLYQEELSVKKFKVKTKTLSETEVLDLLHHPKQETRKAAAEGLTKGLQEEARRLTFIANIMLQDKSIEDKYRKFPNPEYSRHLANEIDQATVDTMTSVVTSNYKLVQEFYELKKKIMKMPKLYDYDRYAPIQEPKEKIPFEKAKEIILTSFSSFSPEYAKIARQFFDNKWIDAATREGKRGGAFCMYVTPDLHPYVLVNYTDKIREVETLAHELGHGVNACLMRKQTGLNFDNPLTLAETSSIFGEMLVFDDLKEKVSKEEKLSLYIQMIESVFASVFRQTAMYKFEQDVHAARKKWELSTEEMNTFWRKRQKEMFGNAVELTADYDWWWSYIPHFWESPFYVYAYSFGELLTLALYAKYKKEGKRFVPKYLRLLELGSTVSPKEALAPLGIDLQKKEFWESGIKVIQELIEEAEKLYQEK